MIVQFWATGCVYNFSAVYMFVFMLIGLDFCALQTVSYARFLLPTNALVRLKSSGQTDVSTAQTPMSRNRINGQKNFTPSRISSTIGQDTGLLHDQIEICVHSNICMFIQ